LEKDESEFGIDNSIKSGISGRCRKCKAEARSKSVRHRNKTSICTGCGAQFEHSYSAKSGYCKMCIGKAMSRKNYEKYLDDNSIAFGYSNMGHFKKFFIEEQNHTCSICRMPDIWNDKPIVFILDHIDGSADNNNRNNLRLVCPNCDSQLDTYKSKNKNSDRAKYRKVIKVSER
jgi:hypothetical protein